MRVLDYDDDHVWLEVIEPMRDPNEIEQEWQDQFRAEFDGQDPWDNIPRVLELHDQLAGDLRENVGMPRSGMGRVPPRERRYKFETLADKHNVSTSEEGWRGRVLEAEQGDS